MGFWHDLGYYLKRLVNLDSASAILFGVSILVLVLGSFVSPPWAVVAFLVVLMWSGFRLWRDDRQVHEREDKLFRDIATTLRGQIDTQPNDEWRMFSFAEQVQDADHHEREFRKHFPSIVETMDIWCASPGLQSALRRQTSATVLEQMPESVPEALRPSLANAIANHVGAYIRSYPAVPKLGRFEVSSDGFISISEGNGQWALYNGVEVDDVEQAVEDLNALTVSALDSPTSQVWMELRKLEADQRQKFRDDLTEVIYGNRLSRRHCTRECYESPF